jgi:hypothetical protein
MKKTFDEVLAELREYANLVDPSHPDWLKPIALWIQQLENDLERRHLELAELICQQDDDDDDDDE